jgi:nitrogen fixation/metabolism regulation signal transduction histidine kinase
MAIVGRTERRLALAIVLTALIPLIVSLYFARSLVDRILAQAFSPELGEHLDQSLGVYQDLAKAIKDGMRYQADGIAARESLRAAAILRHSPSIQQELDAVFPQYTDLVSLGIALPDGTVLAKKDRGRPVDVAAERELEVKRPLAEGDNAPQLVAVFATPRARFDELQRTGEFVRTYHGVENVLVSQGYDLYFFGTVLVIIIGIAATIGALLARSVTRRIGLLATATQTVARGDLTVRVPEQGNDEVTDLSRGFNRMLSEVEINRARVEFLQRMGTWQEMARRLAHEIKNPLTPILLAVEECHRKYSGDDPSFRKLLDTTLEIVEEEVGTLRRLVGEFSSFARLPRAELSVGDLGEFLREQASHAHLLQDDLANTPPFGSAPSKVLVEWKIPEPPMPANIDRQLLRQVLSNVLRNASQAVIAHRGQGKIEVSVTSERDDYVVSVDDDGPGVPETMRDSVFDPYVTTKAEGTGLGLSIVKKVVVEHGGTIDVGASPLGGARFRIRIPRPASPAARAVRELPNTLSRSGVRPPG